MTDNLLIPDGNTEIAGDIPRIVEIIARTSRWVHPKTFHELPVWCPWTARGRPLYDAKWQRRLTNTKRSTQQTSEKFEGNIAAGNALRAALGVSSPKPANWTVCHIWGYDDPKFASQARIVQDPRYFTCIANMVWLPTPLKGFTDALPEIKTILRTCAFHLYGWACEHESVQSQAQSIRAGNIPTHYPDSWPSADRPDIHPKGTAPCTPSILTEIAKRKASLKSMLTDTSLTHFPREEVTEVLAYWKITL